MKHLLLPGLIGFLCVLLPAVSAWDPSCLPHDHPVGFGYKTVGGAGGERVVPQDAVHLRYLLQSKRKLIIDLDKEYDFIELEGWNFTTGCFFDRCAHSGFQQSRAHAGTCVGRWPTTVRFANAGILELNVTSHKTIMSSNGKGVLKGKGLRIRNATNVIIRDITICDINPHIVWGGDGLVLDQVENVWIHNVTVARIGRQHLTTYQRVNKGVTISSCLFDGDTPYAAYCDRRHYWVMILWGIYDEITFVNNQFKNVAGRSPHGGGFSKAKSLIHIIGNYYHNNDMHGAEAYQGTYMLMEGNSFRSYNEVYSPSALGGKLALIDTDRDAEQCEDILKEKCLLNQYINTIPLEARLDVVVLEEFSKLDQKAIRGAREHASKCRKKEGPLVSTGKYSTLIRLLDQVKGMAAVVKLKINGLRLLLPVA